MVLGMWELPQAGSFEDAQNYLHVIRNWFTGLSFDAMSGVDAANVLEFGAKVERLGASMAMVASLKVEDSHIWRQQGHKSAGTFLADPWFVFSR